MVDYIIDGTESKKTVNYRLWNPQAFLPLSLFFSFLLPGILYAINAGKIKGRRIDISQLVFIIVAFIISVSIVIFLADNFENVAKLIAEGINIGLGFLFYHLQKDDFKKWKESELKSRSLGLPILISCIPIGMIILFMIFTEDANTKDKKSIKDSMVNESLYPPRELTAEDIYNLYTFLDNQDFYVRDEKKIDTYFMDDGDHITFVSYYDQNSITTKELVEIKNQFEQAVNDAEIFEKPIIYSPRTTKEERLIE